jgi:hypothetical protein
VNSTAPELPGAGLAPGKMPKGILGGSVPCALCQVEYHGPWVAGTVTEVDVTYSSGEGLASLNCCYL